MAVEIPNLPKGPLDIYREKSSFDWKQMRIAIEGEGLKTKTEIWKKIENDSLFQRNDDNQSLEEVRRLAALRAKKLKQWNLVPFEDFVESIKKSKYFNEACLPYCPSMTVKYSASNSFAQHSLKGLGMKTPKLRALYEQLGDPDTEIVSCFALTEIAHGTNAKDMQTTALYDPNTEEFILNTPNFEAAKCWAGNLGKTASLGIIFARLITPDGNDCGLHAFITPLRDPKTLHTYPGIIIGDMGVKIGLNGIDNGFLIFSEYRIPKENLLNQFGDITSEGKYISPIADPKKRLGASLGALSAGRVAVVSVCAVLLGKAIIIAIRYSAVRKQFGPADKNELPIIEYPLLQWRLFPYIAITYALQIFSNYLVDKYELLMIQMVKEFDIEQISKLGPEMHAICCGAKGLSSWLARDGIQECREACGGHGYLKVAGFGDLRNDNDANLTYEGDNNVLIQQTSNWLLKLWKNKDKPEIWETPLKSVSFLKNWRSLSNLKFLPNSVEETVNPKNLLATYQWLICYLLKKTYTLYQKDIFEGMDIFDVQNRIQVYAARTLSIVFTEYLMLEKMIEFSDAQNAQLKHVLNLMASLCGSWLIEKHAKLCFEGGYYTNNKAIEYLQKGVIDLCSLLKNEAVSLVDAISPPDFIINSPLGYSDGNIYKNLEASFYRNSDTFTRPTWWNELVSSTNTKSKL